MKTSAIIPDESLALLTTAHDRYVSICQSDAPQFELAIQTAQLMVAMRASLTEKIVESLLPLQNTPLGFLTDNKGGYPIAVVRDAVIEAILRGFALVGNEFNIIAGRFYGARNGYVRLVRQCEGLASLRTWIGIPKSTPAGGAIVPATASWTLRGVAMRLETPPQKDGDPPSPIIEIPVRVNDGMIVDAILGKAEAKLYRRIWKMISTVDLGDEAPDGAIDVEATVTPPKAESPLMETARRRRATSAPVDLPASAPTRPAEPVATPAPARVASDAMEEPAPRVDYARVANTVAWIRTRLAEIGMDEVRLVALLQESGHAPATATSLHDLNADQVAHARLACKQLVADPEDAEPAKAPAAPPRAKPQPDPLAQAFNFSTATAKADAAPPSPPPPSSHPPTDGGAAPSSSADMVKRLDSVAWIREQLRALQVEESRLLEFLREKTMAASDAASLHDLTAGQVMYVQRVWRRIEGQLKF